jgi:hypothetical protein
MYTRPILPKYMTDRFAEPQRWSQWFTELDQPARQWTGSVRRRATREPIPMPSSALSAWLQPQADLLGRRKPSRHPLLLLQRRLVSAFR